jgi:hypothetical protein
MATLALACAGKPPRPAEGPVGSSGGSAHLPASAPVDFAFDSLDDRPVNAASTRGKPTIVVFVTTSSLLAQAQVDFLVAMAKHDGDRVNYVAVALEEPGNRELVELYRKSLSIPFPIAIADEKTIAGVGPFGTVNIVPVTVILDGAGRVAWRADGRVAKSRELREVLKTLSGGGLYGGSVRAPPG